MKISCSIVRDLLPLYAEDLASQDTRALVDEHLCSCEDCKSILNTMKTPAPIPAEASPDALNKVKKTIRRRRTVSVMAAVMTVITIASLVFTYMFTPFQLTKDQALEDFYVRDDGAVVIDYAPWIHGRVMSGNGENWYINQYSNRYDMWKAVNRDQAQGSDRAIIAEDRLRHENIDIHYGTWQTADGKIKSDSDIPWRDDDQVVEWESEKNWWYADPRGLGNDILLHDAGKPHPEYKDLFSPIYPVLCFGGIALCLILLVLQKKLKKPAVKEVSIRLSILGGSLAAATLLVSSGNVFTTTVGIIDQYWGWLIPMNTAFLTLTVLFWRQMYLLTRQDKVR